MMERLAGRNAMFRGLIMSAAIVILFAGLRTASPLLNPFIFALVFTLLFLPVFRFLLRRKIAVPIAIALTLALMIGFALLQFFIIAVSLRDLPELIPYYQELWAQRQAELATVVGNTPGASAAAGNTVNIDEDQMLAFVETVMQQLGELVSLSWVILVAIILMMYETVHLPGKFRAAFGQGSILEKQIKSFSRDTVGYLGVKSINNIFVSSAAVVVMVIMGVPFALLWGLLAFWLQFLPQGGLVIATFPAILLVFLEQGIGPAVFLFVILMVFNLIGDNVIQPRITASALDITPFYAFIAFVIGGFILGPVGALLNVPLLFVVKLALETFDQTAWMGGLMNAKTPGSVPAKKSHPRRKFFR
jgi:predicted PurR-regulated permease PerM